MPMRIALLIMCLCCAQLYASCALAIDIVAPDRLSVEAAAYYVERDGQALWARKHNAALPPASLTKLMTVLVAIDTGQLAKPVKISATAAAMHGTRLGLSAGDKMNRADLIIASLMVSANDACLALAESIAGTEAKFVEKMNSKAKALGLEQTHFENACGFEHPRHRSSAADLAKLARVFLRHPMLAHVVSFANGDITVNGKLRRIGNTNALLGIVDGAKGIKTGYTQAAGKCLIAFARRGEHTVLLVMLNAPDRWWDAAGIIEAAFAEVDADSKPQ